MKNYIIQKQKLPKREFKYNHLRNLFTYSIDNKTKFSTDSDYIVLELWENGDLWIDYNNFYTKLDCEFCVIHTVKEELRIKEKEYLLTYDLNL